MKKDLSKLSVEELGKLFPIKLVTYNNNWTDFFYSEKELLLTILGPKIALKIEHFGSTAIPGMLSKPTIDILVEIPGKEILEELKYQLKSIRYRFLEDHTSHILFVKGYNKNGYDHICYHLHMGTQQEDQLWERLYFRDYLIHNPSVANEYKELKIKLSNKHKYNRELYTEGKKDFIEKITLLAKTNYN